MIIDSYRFAAASSLLTGLVSWWSLDEVSGDRADAHGSNTLTDNNSVGSGSGVIDTAASFTAANSEYLSIANADAGDFDFNSDFTISVWINATSLTTDHRVVESYFGGGYRLFIESGDFFFDVIDGTTTSRARNTTNPTIGGWHHLVIGWDSGDGKSFLYLDNGSVVQGVTNNGPNSPITNGSAFTIGALQAGNAKYWDGLIDEFAVWSRTLTADERSDLYNSGAGIGYPG